MAKDVKFGYFNKSEYLHIQFMEFKRNYLEEECKFIQIKINEEEYIRIGNLYHKDILEETLNEFGLKFERRKNKKGIDVPLEKGENYDLIGAGKVRFYGEKLNFYDASADYFNYVNGTNGESLEKIFGIENVTQVEGFNQPSFLVKISQQ